MITTADILIEEGDAPEASQQVELGGGSAVAGAALQGQGVGEGGSCPLLRQPKLTVPQAARALGIGETKMREIIRNGDIPVIRILGKVILLERDLEEYMQGHYGAMRKPRKEPRPFAALPDHIRDSDLLRKLN